MLFPEAFSMTSNYELNRVNAGMETFGRSFMMGADMAYTAPNTDLSSFNLGRQRFDLNEGMVEMRRSYVNQKRVEINSRIDYLPEPNQTTLSLAEDIRVTEIIRTQNIVRTKFIQPPFPDAVTLCLNEMLRRPAFEDQINHPRPFPQLNSCYDTRLQLYNQDRNSDHLGFNVDQTNMFFGSFDRHESSVRLADQVLGLDPMNMQFNETREEKFRNSPQEFNYIDLLLQQHKTEPGFADHLNSFPRTSSLEGDAEEDRGANDYDVGDGRTHSLPHGKYGPYTCPRCRGVFVTSQQFAAHVGSHYKLESPNEKARRRAAKNKSKNIQLLQTKYGLKVLPKSFKPSEARKKWRKSTLWISDEENSTEENKGGVAGENGGILLEGLFDVDVKLQLP